MIPDITLASWSIAGCVIIYIAVIYIIRKY